MQYQCYSDSTTMEARFQIAAILKGKEEIFLPRHEIINNCELRHEYCIDAVNTTEYESFLCCQWGVQTGKNSITPVAYTHSALWNSHLKPHSIRIGRDRTTYCWPEETRIVVDFTSLTMVVPSEVNYYAITVQTAMQKFFGTHQGMVSYFCWYRICT